MSWSRYRRRPTQYSTLLPYTTLFRSVVVIATHTRNRAAAEQALKQLEPLLMQQADEVGNPAFKRGQQAQIAYVDRKSTRLNSSHVAISYAVFCLKKKNKAILRLYGAY